MCLRVCNASNGAVLAVCARLADSFWRRALGLVGRSGLAAGEGLVLVPCAAVHTWFMRFTIDVVLVDGEGRVVRAVPEVRPFRTVSAAGGRITVELPAGTLRRSQTREGDRLTFTGRPGIWTSVRP